MRRLLTPVLFAACASDPTPRVVVPDLPIRPFDEPSGGASVHLLASTAELVLAESSRPPGDAGDSRWDLGIVTHDPEMLPNDDARRVFVVSLPFSVPDAETRFRPSGMRVFDGDDELTYDMSPLAPGHAGWRVKDGMLLVTTAGPDETVDLSVEYSGLRNTLDRFNRDTAGLTDAEFASWSHTDADITSNGLLLPAPSTASWSVDLPRDAVFRSEPIRLDTATATDAADGASVRLVVEPEGGSAVVVDERSVGAGRSWWPWSRDPVWRVDLGRWAGQTVTLRLETDPVGNPEHDYVYIGAPTVSGRPEAQPRRVVVIAVDTLRPDHLGNYGYHRDTSPELDALAAESIVFENSWAPAPRTRPSFRSAFTGRGALDAVGAMNTAERFQQNGFATAGFAANIHLSPRFHFTDGFDHWELKSSQDADEQVDAALDWLSDHAHEDTFLFLHLMDPHLFYKPPAGYDTLYVDDPDPDLPEEFNRWTVLGWMDHHTLDDRRKAHIEALYDGEVTYTSSEVGRFLDALEAFGDNTTVVFHTDHGEEFWEHGGYEHNHALWDEVVRTALWFRMPPSVAAEPQRHTEPVALWDISPTLLDIAGIEPMQTDGRSLLPLATGEDPGGWNRALPVAHLMYDVEQWGVVVDGHKYSITTTEGVEALYDLGADPGETTNLAGTVDLDPYRGALAAAHGMAVTPGWRIELSRMGGRPLTWNLPAPALAAWVIDPEAGRRGRANLVWGERPPVTADDVATLTLSDDGTALTITPGSSSHGTVAVAFAEDVSLGGTVTQDDRTVPTTMSGRGMTLSEPGLEVRAHAGVVLRPPPGEADRIQGGGGTDDDVLRLLQDLGYVGQHE